MAEGVRIHAVEAAPPRRKEISSSDATTIVLIHGAGLDHRDWTFSMTSTLRAELGPKVRIIAFDRPGFGDSERPRGSAAGLPAAQARLLRKAAAAFGVRNAVLVGHSWGGAVAMAWALAAQADGGAPDGAVLSDAPEVIGVASLAGAILPWSFAQSLKNARRVGEAARLAWSSGGMNATGMGAAAKAALSDAFHPNQPPEGYLAHIATELSPTDGAAASTMADVATINGALAAQGPKLSTLSAPVELVYGDADEVLSIDEQGERALGLIPQARLTRLEGVGHMVHHAAPEACLAAIGRLAAGVKPA